MVNCFSFIYLCVDINSHYTNDSNGLVESSNDMVTATISSTDGSVSDSIKVTTTIAPSADPVEKKNSLKLKIYVIAGSITFFVVLVGVAIIGAVIVECL